MGELRIAQLAPRCTVLGPGVRGVVWVQGCSRGCPGCISPEMQPWEGGTAVSTENLAEYLGDLREIEGITISGGEPLAQAEGLNDLMDRLRERDFGWMAYTGYTLEEILEAGTEEQRKWVRRLDILVDGPYREAEHCNGPWRGSKNQRIHFLTPRYRSWQERLGDLENRLEWVWEGNACYWMGIPPRGFREKWETIVREVGFSFQEEK
ncbi:MAG: 4Fe-4S single cluster domain-containing protein [Planctomycetia bacterium]|nr:4Fe-4S single cluster domain-containing protein [Planctomycetia bacterium]